MNKDTPLPSEESHNFEGLLDYCETKDFYISDSLRPQYSPLSGLGLHATNRIQKGQKLIFAPTASLLTTKSIPESFCPDSRARQDLTVHGLLAAWLAFGDQEEIRVQYGAWMDVWPTWESFRDGMPVFWGFEDLRAPERKQAEDKKQVQQQNHERKRRKVSNESNTNEISHKNSQSDSGRIFSLSPSISDHFLTFSKEQNSFKPPGLLSTQANKIRHILSVLSLNSDHLGFDILSSKSATHLVKFLHMWCCVNTRCFYYIPYRQPKPSDPNEAMALVPFQDLFNHCASTTKPGEVDEGCKVKYDRRGFSVHANRDYEAGEEIYLKYGRHSDDALWVEYGFMLGSLNDEDELKLDDIISQSITEEQRTMLLNAEYLGDYTVKPEGVCWRTEITAWLCSGCLTNQQWAGMVAGTFDPEKKGQIAYAEMKSRVIDKIVEWLTVMDKECEANIEVLTDMKETGRVVEAFVPSLNLLGKQEKSRVELTRIANDRWTMCMRRWKDVQLLCGSAIRNVGD